METVSLRELLYLALYGSASIEAVLLLECYGAINTWQVFNIDIKMEINLINNFDLSEVNVIRVGRDSVGWWVLRHESFFDLDY